MISISNDKKISPVYFYHVVLEYHEPVDQEISHDGPISEQDYYCDCILLQVQAFPS